MSYSSRFVYSRVFNRMKNFGAWLSFYPVGRYSPSPQLYMSFDSPIYFSSTKNNAVLLGMLPFLKNTCFIYRILIDFIQGEPGVGKTAIAQGLALRIVNRDVPYSLNARIFSLDMGSLLASTTCHGKLELVSIIYIQYYSYLLLDTGCTHSVSRPSSRVSYSRYICWSVIISVPQKYSRMKMMVFPSYCTLMTYILSWLERTREAPVECLYLHLGLTQNIHSVYYLQGYSQLDEASSGPREAALFRCYDVRRLQKVFGSGWFSRATICTGRLDYLQIRWHWLYLRLW